jgi:hypothetical protein
LKPEYVHAVNVVRIYRAPRGPRQAVNHGR